MGLFSSTPLLYKPDSAATRAPSAPVTTAAAAQEQLKTYDYVICGGGTAGSVLASRLSEDPNNKVLVIEAGFENTPLECKVPLTFTKLFQTKYDWDYKTTPQNDKLRGAEMQWPRGKLLGGSSSMNAMMYQPGGKGDYDTWAEDFGCKGWSYADMAPYARRIENFTPRAGRPAMDPQYRPSGEGGLVQTGHTYLSEIGEKGFLKAATEVGLEDIADINTPKGPHGAVRFMTFIDQKGQRSSAATAYLSPEVQRRQNLKIVLETRVTRVLFEQSGSGKPRAIGVEMQSAPNAPLFQVAARKEVLVCGGAINSPQTLMLSGIGPAAELKKHNIPVVVDSPHVGKHLKDHLVTSPIVARVGSQHTFDYLANDLKALPALLQWLAFGKGPLTSNVGETALFFDSTDPKLPVWDPEVSKEENRPRKVSARCPCLEVIATPIAYIDHGKTPAPPGHGNLSMVPIGLRPLSEGEITLASASAWDKAIIDPRYWSDEEDNDRKVMLAGVRLCLAILKAPALQKYMVDVPKSNDPDNHYFPWCADGPVSDDVLLDWMGRKAFTLYHPVGAARCGPTGKPEDAVVDLDLKVNGVDGLRVVDLSIAPEQIAGHPAAVAMCIGEKLSDVILGRDVAGNGAIKT